MLKITPEQCDKFADMFMSRCNQLLVMEMPCSCVYGFIQKHEPIEFSIYESPELTAIEYILNIFNAKDEDELKDAFEYHGIGYHGKDMDDPLGADASFYTGNVGQMKIWSHDVGRFYRNAAKHLRRIEKGMTKIHNIVKNQTKTLATQE